MHFKMLLLAIQNLLRFVIALFTVVCKETPKTQNLGWLLRRTYNRQPCICSAWPYIAGNFIHFRPIQGRGYGLCPVSHGYITKLVEIFRELCRRSTLNTARSPERLLTNCLSSPRLHGETFMVLARPPCSKRT